MGNDTICAIQTNVIGNDININIQPPLHIYTNKKQIYENIDIQEKQIKISKYYPSLIVMSSKHGHRA